MFWQACNAEELQQITQGGFLSLVQALTTCGLFNCTTTAATVAPQLAATAAPQLAATAALFSAAALQHYRQLPLQPSLPAMLHDL